CVVFVFFFFSSRRRHTRFSRDWSSDVCSSDLLNKLAIRATPPTIPLNRLATDGALDEDPLGKPVAIAQPARLDAHQVAAVQVLRPVDAALVFDGRAAVVEQARLAGVTGAFQADH